MLLDSREDQQSVFALPGGQGRGQIVKLFRVFVNNPAVRSVGVSRGVSVRSQLTPDT